MTIKRINPKKWNHPIEVIQTNVERNVPVTSDTWPDALRICDKNGTLIGYLRGQFLTGEYEGIMLETLRTVNGSTLWHGLRMEINSSGTPHVSVNYPEAWRSGLGVLGLSGGNVTGMIKRVKPGGVSYIAGMTNAALHVDKATGSVWYPMVSTRTAGGGGWAIGNYSNERLQFVYGTKANIDKGTNTTVNVELTEARRFIAAGYDTSSDKRLKTHIENLGKAAVDFIKSLIPAKFSMDGSTRVGFYAQDVLETCGDVDMISEDSDGMLTLDYSQIIAPLVATVQDLSANVEALTDRVKELEGKLADQQ